MPVAACCGGLEIFQATQYLIISSDSPFSALKSFPLIIFFLSIERFIIIFKEHSDLRSGQEAATTTGMNNDTPEKPNTMTETSMKEDMLDAKWEEASRSEVHIFFRKYVSNSRPLQSQASVREKLLVLSHDRFEHLCTDFYDEYLRRKVGMAQGQKLEHLPPVQGLHPTRNLSRMKMAALPPASFRELAEDILYELSRRHPDDATEFSAIGTSMLDISSIEIERRHFLGLDTLATRNPSLTSVDQIQQKPEAVRKNAVPPTLKPKAVKRSLPGGTSLKTASQKKAKR